MAQLFTVRDIEDADDGDIVKEFRGTITRFLGKHSSGTNRNGEWSFQHMLVKDDDGDEIKLTLKNMPPVSTNLKGAEVEARAHKGAKDWTGLYAKDDEYNGETKRILQATKTCELLIDGKEIEAEESDRDDRSERKRSSDREERPRDREREERPRSRDRDEERPRSRDDDRKRDDDRGREERSEKRRSSEDVEQATDIGLKLRNVMDMALDLAYDTMREFEKRSKLQITSEMILNNAHTYFIQMSKERVHDMVPTEPLLSAASEDPEDEDKGGDKEEDEKPKGKRK